MSHQSLLSEHHKRFLQSFFSSILSDSAYTRGVEAGILGASVSQYAGLSRYHFLTKISAWIIRELTKMNFISFELLRGAEHLQISMGFSASLRRRAEVTCTSAKILMVGSWPTNIGPCAEHSAFSFPLAILRVFKTKRQGGLVQNAFENKVASQSPPFTCAVQQSLEYLVLSQHSDFWGNIGCLRRAMERIRRSYAVCLPDYRRGSC